MKMNPDNLTPMMRQYFEIKNEYEDYILFYRLGDFYEMFFDDAVTASRELELTLTARNSGNGEKAPLCGVPYHSAETYIRRLIEKGFKVAICEQTEDPSKAKGLVKREVVKIITPGTITDPDMLRGDRNSYLLSLYFDDDHTGLSYVDLLSGEVRATYFAGHGHASMALNEAIKISPNEVLINDDITTRGHIEWLISQDIYVTGLSDRYFKKSQSEKILTFFGVNSFLSLGVHDTHEIVKSLQGLLEYVMETQKKSSLQHAYLSVYNESNFMMLDRSTITNLELFETIRAKEKKGSLLWVIDRTSTPMGARKLRDWMRKPLLDKNSIELRLDLVEALYKSDIYRDDIVNQLKGVYDLERLVSKISFGTLMPKDALAIMSSLVKVPYIQESLLGINNEKLSTNLQAIRRFDEVTNLIRGTIAEDPKTLLKDGGFIREDYSEQTEELNYIIKNGSGLIMDLESREKEKTGIKTLKVRYNRVFGYYIEVSKSYMDSVPETYIRKQTLANAERYFTEELKDIESKIFSAKDELIALEQEIYADFLTELNNHLDELRKLSDKLGMLDVIVSFAKGARDNGYTRPKIANNESITIEGGRHPVVEKLVKNEHFISNDAYIDTDSNQLMVITGPNMAGKSTYLRQVAIITLMAQLGCFVPADEAEIGIVDRIFTRVGASDDLSSGQSTFMVEMSELANILNNSTRKSLVILDEIGRGTSTYDGLSIAWSVIEYLTKPDRKTKTLFATHYHELSELEDAIDGVNNFSIAVREVGDSIVFLRKIVRGSAMRSYGIEVAKLAGLPKEVIQKAEHILSELENSDIIRLHRKNPISENKKADTGEEMLRKAIRDITPDDLTPLEALNMLYRLKGMAENETNQ